MDMTGEQVIPLPQGKVWEALNDPEVLKACIPGCEKVEKLSDSDYRVLMTATVGPVKAKFTGKMSITDANPPNRYTLTFEGTGGAAGFAKGGAQVVLAPDGSSTRLTYTASATVGGKLAQVGSRLIDGIARKTAEEFFARFNQTVGAPAPAAEAEEISVPHAPPPVSKWLWILIAAIIVAVLLYKLL
jgi:hypothetical protein